jgi:predicted dehydrogenase/nucleoside-diphosphate-sugar epimerase
MSGIGIGIIGCGLIADTHVDALKCLIPNANIYVSDIIPGKADLLRKEYSLAGSYLDYREMFRNEDLVAVHVLTPPQYHVEQALEAMKAGFHVIVEKPIAFSVKEVTGLYQEAQRLQKVVSVGHSLLCQPSVIKVLDYLRKNGNEEVLFVNSFYGIESDSILPIKNKNNGHWKNSIPGGPIIDSLVHPVSLLVEFTGDPLNVNSQTIFRENNASEVHICWKGNGVIANVLISNSAKPFRRMTEVVTNRRTFVVDHSADIIIVSNIGPGPRSVQKVYRNLSYSYQFVKGTLNTVGNVIMRRMKQNPGTRGIIQNFYECLREGKSRGVSVSEQNVVNTTALIEKVIQETGNADGKIINENKAIGTLSKKLSGGLVLVTGASGFLGRSLCEKLSDCGITVRAQVRRGQNADRICSRNIKKIYADFKYDDVDYDSLTKDANVIVHAAHASGAKTFEQHRRINVDTALKLYDAGARNRCDLFIYISSVAVYGLKNTKKPVLEEDSLENSGRYYEFYIRSKIAGENQLRSRAGVGNPNLVILRPGILYSPEGERLTKKSIPLRDGTRMFVVIGNGKNSLPYTRGDILSNAICDIIINKPAKGGTFNLTGAQLDTSEAFIRKRLHSKGITCKFVKIPATPLLAMSTILEALYRITGRQCAPNLSKYVIGSAIRSKVYDNSRAIECIGWDPIKAIAIE